MFFWKQDLHRIFLQIYSGFIFASLIMVMTMVFQVYLTEYLNENALLRTEMQKSEKLNIVSELAASVWHMSSKSTNCCSWIYPIARKYGRCEE